MKNISWKNFKKNFWSYLPAILILGFGIALINTVLKIQDQMNNQLVSDADIEKALDYLRDTAVSAAESKAARVYLEEYRKCLKAMIMQEHNQLPVSAHC